MCNVSVFMSLLSSLVTDENESYVQLPKPKPAIAYLALAYMPNVAGLQQIGC